MAIKNKQVKLNNYSVVDTNPNENNFEASRFEKDLINKFINEVYKKEVTKIQISKISSNFFYESYALLIDNNKMLLKISLDPDNKKLHTEKIALNHVPNNISPTIIAHKSNEKDGIEFLLTTWENAESFEIYGVDDLVYNLGTLCAVIDGVHESRNEGVLNFKNKFFQNESVSSLFEVIDPKEVLIFEKLVDLNIEDLEKIFLKIKEEYLPGYTEEPLVLSHGNVKNSNILYLSGYIKLINFQNCYSCDLYYSLFNTVIDLYLYHNEKTVKEFLKKYHSSSKVLGGTSVNEFLENYEKKKKLNSILTFQDLLHKILLHFVIYGAYYKSDYLIKYMNTYLFLKPMLEEVFPEYIKSFDKLFFTVMPTVETYDIEQLQIIKNM